MKTNIIIRAIFPPAALLACMLIMACSLTCSTNTSTDTVSSPKANEHKTNPVLSPAAACIDGKQALSHIETIVSFGARHPGTPGVERTRKYIIDTLKKDGLAPKEDPFTAYTPHPDLKTVQMANISVDITGSTQKVIMITGHFDGKIIPQGVFVGANDGGSSTGLLLEMARCLKKHPIKESVKIVFFDGEEALVKWTESDSLYGSKHMAAKLAETGEHNNIAALVNVDMVGDSRLRYFQERHSTPWVWKALVDSGVQLGRGDLFTGPQTAVGDDHLPFLHIGIPAAVLIDLHYGPGWNSNAYWHTHKDDLNHISPESLEITGQIVLKTLPTLAKGPKG